MGRVKYYAADVKHLTGNQKIILDGRFGLYVNLLSMFHELTFHELAYRVHQHKTHNKEAMVKEEELGYALLRLVEEGLVGMKGTNVCKQDCCSLDNVSVGEKDES